MLITDDHARTLRAILANEESAAELLDQIQKSELGKYFNVVVASAFAIAIRRRFERGYSGPQVIQFVAGERTRHGEGPGAFDPQVAEQLVLSVLTGKPAPSLDEEAKADAQIALLISLIEQASFDEAELTRFVEEARATAERAIPEVEHLFHRSYLPGS